MKALLLGLLLLGTGACIRHEAVVRTPDPQHHSARGVVAGRPVARLGGHRARSGGQPQVSLVHGWYRQADGPLVFLDGEARSPLAWWQRFPVDILTDLAWPGTITSRDTVQLHERRPPQRDVATIDRIASQAGYGPRRAAAVTDQPAR